MLTDLLRELNDVYIDLTVKEGEALDDEKVKREYIDLLFDRFFAREGFFEMFSAVPLLSPKGKGIEFDFTCGYPSLGYADVAGYQILAFSYNPTVEERERRSQFIDWNGYVILRQQKTAKLILYHCIQFGRLEESEVAPAKIGFHDEILLSSYHPHPNCHMKVEVEVITREQLCSVVGRAHFPRQRNHFDTFYEGLTAWTKKVTEQSQARSSTLAASITRDRKRRIAQDYQALKVLAER